MRPKGGEQHQQQQQSDKENGQCPDARQLFRREQHHAEEQLDAQREAEYDAGQKGGFPDATGVAAFAQRGTSAIEWELSCQDSYSGDALAVLTDFLNSCTY